MVEIKRGWRQRSAVGVKKAIKIVQPQVALRTHTLAGLRLRIGWQQHSNPGAPGGQQGDGQFTGIVEVQRQAFYATALQLSRQLQGMLAQLGVIQVRAYCATGVGVEQQVLEGQPVHSCLLTRWRTSHSPANSRPIRP